MSNPNGLSGQGMQLTIGAVTLKATRMKLRRTFNNADTTVSGNGYDNSTPIWRGWFIDVEIPWGPAISVDGLFDTSDYETETPTGQPVNFTLSDGSYYSGQAILDGDYQIDSAAKDAVRLVFTMKGVGAFTS